MPADGSLPTLTVVGLLRWAADRTSYGVVALALRNSHRKNTSRSGYLSCLKPYARRQGAIPLSSCIAVYNEAMSAITQLTAEEFSTFPKTPGKQELLDGELISLPPAKHDHSKIARAFLKLLEAVLDKSRVWVLRGLPTETSWLIPDVSVIWPANQYPAGSRAPR